MEVIESHVHSRYPRVPFMKNIGCPIICNQCPTYTVVMVRRSCLGDP